MPEPMSLPTVDAQPVEIGQPPSLQQQAQTQQPAQQPRVSGYTGKGGQTLNFVDKFLQGWMAGKNIKEAKFIQQRANSVKAHQVTADSMYTAAQQAADAHRSLQDSGAPADQVEAAKKKAADTYSAYSQEQAQLAKAYAEHLGVGDKKAEGVKGKVKQGVQKAFMPQVAEMMLPHALEAMAKPRPLREPSEAEKNTLTLQRREIARADQDKAVNDLKLEDARARQGYQNIVAAGPPADGNAAAMSRYNNAREMLNMPDYATTVAQRSTAQADQAKAQYEQQRFTTAQAGHKAIAAGGKATQDQVAAILSVDKPTIEQGFIAANGGDTVKAYREMRKIETQYSAPSEFQKLKGQMASDQERALGRKLTSQESFEMDTDLMDRLHPSYTRIQAQEAANRQRTITSRAEGEIKRRVKEVTETLGPTAAKAQEQAIHDEEYERAARQVDSETPGSGGPQRVGGPKLDSLYKKYGITQP